ncbi:hypothetical protein B5S30_g1099 [[Candida] boidinii]|nr:hypothetical protein B5S30_g1099 [[Candida] boidinii]
MSRLRNSGSLRGKSNNYQEFDPESGTIGRKKSLVRRERTRNSFVSLPSSNSLHSHLKKSDSKQSVRYNNTGSSYLDHDFTDSIPLSNLQPLNEEEKNPYDINTVEYPMGSSSDILTEQQQQQQTHTQQEGREYYGLNDEITTDDDVNRHNSSKSYKSQNTGRSNNNGGNNDNNDGEDDDDDDENYRDDEALLKDGYYSFPNSKYRYNEAEESKKFPYWKVYCYIVTFWAPAPLLRLFGFHTFERQYAWREKMALLSIIVMVGGIIAFLTFGFTRAACVGVTRRLQPKDISTGYLVINGRAYNLDSSAHPGAAGIDAGTNILYPPVNAGGKDATFLFQNVNGNCKGLIKPKQSNIDNLKIPHDNDELAWYMPCKLFDLDGSTSPNFTYDYYYGYACHTSSSARDAFYSLDVSGDVYYKWDDISNSSRNLLVYNGYVLDMDLLDWIDKDEIEYPELFDQLKNDKAMHGHDISVLLTSPHEKQVANCLAETIKVGVIDVDTIGCIASDIVLYISYVFVLSIVFVKFLVACYFKWVIAPRQGASTTALREMAARDKNIDKWSDDPKSAAPLTTVPEKRRANFHNSKHARTQSRYFGAKNRQSKNPEIFQELQDYSTTDYKPKYITMTTEAYMIANSQTNKRATKTLTRNSMFAGGANDLDNPFGDGNMNSNALTSTNNMKTLASDLIHSDAIPQPPVDWEPYGYPLVHTMCLVTCYSEDEAGIRTTLDSIATTDYPNSHKLIVIICDGMITGSGNDKSTPDVCLGLMTDFSVPKEEVQPYSYVSVAQGAKRHNMAKVYAGFYKYNDETVPIEKQQKIPVITIVKCGTPAELTTSKPGNRGKRDSQIILMSFLQKITFNDRMTELEFEILKSIWSITGLMAQNYETLLMVDADTLVYPDCLTHMVAEFVKHPDIMGLCGETKISNKAQSWVTAIQVFEYYISHHLAKSFESVFGSVTCLPGCFSMYRIKTPKDLNVWVPILSNADIVAKYSENVLDSLHKKNLLLLGEDRYLSSLMLRTFPRRKQIFVPKAACKTVVPDKFSVLLSQRRRWINSTVHNLMELVLVRDLCGVFCFSMQFVIFIEFIGTLVLPASITFTLYILIIAMVQKPTPYMSLILMLIIFGLPALLIVVTISNLTYILWMFIYLIALPIWNFVLPTYAYWKFDDFSWGDTRQTEGGDKGAHDNNDGEFDGSQIIQRTWADLERERCGLLNTTTYRIPTVYNPGYYEDTPEVANQDQYSPADQYDINQYDSDNNLDIVNMDQKSY